MEAEFLLCFKELNITRGVTQVLKSEAVSESIFSAKSVPSYCTSVGVGGDDKEWLQWLST